MKLKGPAPQPEMSMGAVPLAVLYGAGCHTPIWFVRTTDYSGGSVIAQVSTKDGL